MAILSLMTEHPRTVGETYAQHCRFAVSFAGWLSLAAGAAAVHAVLPFLFKSTASTILRRLCDRMDRRH